MNTNRQRELPFEPSREQARLARVERLLSGRWGLKLKTAARLFDEKAFREASLLAAQGGAGASAEKPSPVNRRHPRAHFSAHFEGFLPMKPEQRTRKFANHNDAVI